MPELIPDFAFKGYSQPFVGRPIEAIKEYYKEGRDAYNEVAQTYDMIDEAYDKAPVADLNPDKEIFSQRKAQTKQKLQDLLGKGDLWAQKAQARKIAQSSAAELGYFSDRNKQFKEYQDAVSKNPNLSPDRKEIAIDSYRNQLNDYNVDASGNKSLRNITPYVETKEISPEEVSKGLNIGTKKTINPRGKIANITLPNGSSYQQIYHDVTSGPEKGAIQQESGLAVNDERLVNTRLNQARDYSYSSNKAKAASIFGVNYAEVLREKQNILSSHPNISEQDADHAAFINAAKRQHQSDIQKHLTDRYPTSSEPSISNLPEGYQVDFGSGSKADKKVQVLQPGVDIKTFPDEDKKGKAINPDFVHTGGFAVKTGKLQRTQGLDYYDDEGKQKHIPAANIDFDFATTYPTSKKKITIGNKDITKGSPLSYGQMEELTKEYLSKNPKASESQTQDYVNELLGQKVMLNAVINTVEETGKGKSLKGYIPIDKNDIQDIISQNDIKDKKEIGIMEDTYKRQGQPYDISTIYDRVKSDVSGTSDVSNKTTTKLGFSK